MNFKRENIFLSNISACVCHTYNGHVGFGDCSPFGDLEEQMRPLLIPLISLPPAPVSLSCTLSILNMTCWHFIQVE